MASQPLEALLQSVGEPRTAGGSRTAERPTRAGDDAGRFAPVLDRALHTDDAPAPRRREHQWNGDAESTDVAADHDEAAAGSEQASAAPETDDDDAAEGAETAAAAAGQTLTNADSTDDALSVAAVEEISTAGAAEAAADQQSGESAPQNSPPPTSAVAGGEDNLELGEATPAADATEIGDVLPTRQDAKDRETTHAAAAAQLAGNAGDAESTESSTVAAATDNADATAAAQKSTPTNSESGSDDGPLASPDSNAEASDGIEPVASMDDGGEGDAGAETPHRAVEAPPDAKNDGVQTSAAGEAPSDHHAAPASGAADSAARGAAALGRLSADRTSSAGDAPSDVDGIGHVDRGRFLGRVEGAIRTAQQRDGRVQVRLSPPELGALRIELTVHNGVLSARLEAETSAARNLLLDNLPALRDRLAQQDIRVERFDVDLRGDGGGSNQHEAQDRPAGDPSWRQSDQRRERAATKQGDILRRPRTATSQTTGDAALDVRV